MEKKTEERAILAISIHESGEKPIGNKGFKKCPFTYFAPFGYGFLIKSIRDNMMRFNKSCM